MGQKQFPPSIPAWFWPVLGVGAAVRLAFLGHDGFWHDEVLSLLIAGQPGWWSTARIAGLMQFGSAAYFTVLHGWLMLGRDEATVRMLSAAGSIVALWMALRLVEATVPPLSLIHI